MSSDTGDRPDPTAPAAEPEFTVPLPRASDTQALPHPEPTRELPAVPPSPGAGALRRDAAQPAWPAGPDGGMVGLASGSRADGDVDPLLEQIGVALFWITVGWWVFVLVRVLGYFVRFGGDSTILIRTIDLGAEETIIAAVLSVLAALLLLFGRGTRGRSPLGYASGALAVVTVAVAVWRLLP
jgi:hypothetical protein